MTTTDPTTTTHSGPDYRIEVMRVPDKPRARSHYTVTVGDEVISRGYSKPAAVEKLEQRVNAQLPPGYTVKLMNELADDMFLALCFDGEWFDGVAEFERSPSISQCVEYAWTQFEDNEPNFSWLRDEHEYRQGRGASSAGFSAGEVCSGERELIVDVDGRTGSVYLSREMWQAIGDGMSWTTTSTGEARPSEVPKPMQVTLLLASASVGSGGLRVGSRGRFHGLRMHVVSSMDELQQLLKSVGHKYDRLYEMSDSEDPKLLASGHYDGWRPTKAHADLASRFAQAQEGMQR